MTYQLTLLKYAHFQNVLQEHHFLKLNIMNKLISKIKFIKFFQILPLKKNNYIELLVILRHYIKVSYNKPSQQYDRIKILVVVGKTKYFGNHNDAV